MLGVRREGVTEAAGILQRSGLLHCSRGRITVVDRAGIEEHCCECYGVVKREYDRLLPNVAPPAAVSPDRSGRYSTWNACPEAESSASACRGSLDDRVAPLIDRASI